MQERIRAKYTFVWEKIFTMHKVFEKYRFEMATKTSG
jgi:hypothetical protein